MGRKIPVEICSLVLFWYSLYSRWSHDHFRPFSIQETRLSAKFRICGDRLSNVIFAICTGQIGRAKRHAVPEPSYNLSPFLMSIYRPSIDDDRSITDGNWELNRSPLLDRFANVEVLRVCIMGFRVHSGIFDEKLSHAQKNSRSRALKKSWKNCFTRN